MKNIITLTLGFLFIISQSIAQENSLLWKISGKDLKKESYILGTIHLICEEDYTELKKIATVSSKVDQVIFELNMNDPAIAQQAQALAMTPNTDFVNQMTDEQRNLIDSALTANQLSLQMFDIVSPATVISLLTLKAFACSDLSKIRSIEKEVLALNPNKPVYDLETLEFQMDVLNKLATPKYFYDYFKNYADHSKLTKQLVDYYNAEDLEGLKAMFTNEKYMTNDQFKLMLTDRNVKWTKDIPVKIKNTSTLIAIGAGHLVGDTGLIQLLKNDGYNVTPVYN